MTSPETHSEYQQRRARERKEQEARWLLVQLDMERMGLIRNCLNCEYFDPNIEGCDKAQKQRPPATVIARGCPSWDQIIPF